MQSGTLNLTDLMRAIPRWSLNPQQIPYQFAAHCLEDPRDTTTLSGAPVFIQHLWPGEHRIRFYLSPDARRFYRMAILNSHRIVRGDYGFIELGEFQIRAPGMPLDPLELHFDYGLPTLYDSYKSLALGPPIMYQDPLVGPTFERQRGAALDKVVGGKAHLYDVPAAYRIQYLESVGPEEYLLVGALDCAQLLKPENFIVYRGRPGQMAKLKVTDMDAESENLTILTDNGKVNVPGDSLLALACAFPASRCAIQDLFLTSRFESLLGDKLKQHNAQIATVAKQLGLESTASEKLILGALGINLGPFPTREAFEAWNGEAFQHHYRDRH